MYTQRQAPACQRLAAATSRASDVLLCCRHNKLLLRESAQTHRDHANFSALCFAARRRRRVRHTGYYDTRRAEVVRPKCCRRSNSLRPMPNVDSGGGLSQRLHSDYYVQQYLHALCARYAFNIVVVVVGGGGQQTPQANQLVRSAGECGSQRRRPAHKLAGSTWTL